MQRCPRVPLFEIGYYKYMKFSKLGQKLSGNTGTLQLMQDLGAAIAAKTPPLMLGGGNPARITKMEDLFKSRLQAIAQADDDIYRTLGLYDGSRGEQRFLEDMAALLHKHCGWPIGPENIAITNGSQTAFFYLFNLFGGAHADGRHHRIFLPMSPEYMGYADQGLTDNLFVAQQPRVELLDEGLFKYRLNLDVAAVPRDIAAICVTRPTNPTGNVLTNAELHQLIELAKARDVPLLVDNAYGAPFPNIVFEDAELPYSDQCIYCLSLSKLGLPGVRTGIVVGPQPVVQALEAMNAVVSLASNSMGPALVHELVRGGQLVDVSREVIRPFYASRMQSALATLQAELEGLPCRVHKPEGAFFFWLWCEGLPISAQALYERLKQRGVIVVPGHYFFPGLSAKWSHRDECVRINYGGSAAEVDQGLRIIGNVLRAVYAQIKSV
jgi:valine--pyruvate aminotransferase